MSGGRKVLWLVPKSVSADALEAVEGIRARILAGETVGLAWVEMHKTYDWTIDAAGECKREIALTRGQVAALDDELAAITRSEKA